jgi:large-conductance mechanosensitive channel
MVSTGGAREVLTQLANTLRDEGAIDKRESCIHASIAAAKAAGAPTLNYRVCLQSVFDILIIVFVIFVLVK